MDTYLNRLRGAAYDWLEKRRWWARGVKRSRKDRTMGRAVKRGARQEDRRAVEREAGEQH